ncbi:ecto-ADP-ribosyltransferase 5-like isoform 2-T3 [Clarias gariepinus]|uniref:ecto-ADP-ribosyltransferase 5-like isoform X4 n=1 Tax=Clarias gariepinus TaxID=13013 RepID=UPI00234C90E3|nr:ecto-ADP-ribosyltransferase 5-like isoform X4 [Clarias gariepinus]
MGGVSVRVRVFILVTVFSLSVRAEEKTLDMAPDAVDDDFSQCRDKMLKAVTEPDGLLQKELNANKEFKDVWNKHSGGCTKNIPGGTSHHISALQVYANSGTKFRKTFNDLVYSKGSNNTTYREEFPFKSLHFLLTDSLRLLNPSNLCQTVFYGTENIYTARTGTEVRIGKFLRAQTGRISETEVVSEGGTLFNITSCSVVNVEENTCKSEHVQWLISPAEVFTVQNVTDVESSDDTPYKEITLTHSRFLSKPTCSFFHRNTADAASSTSLAFPLLTLMASLLSHFTVME